MKSQKQEITNSLRVIQGITKRCKAEYRILGSVVLVAYKDRIFRQIHDIDILLNEEAKDCVFKHLQEIGFILRTRSWGNFRWVEADKKNYLGLTFFLIGKFTPSYFTYSFLRICELRVDAKYLAPTEYDFNGIKFIGIPISSAIAGIHQAFLNPKRKRDKKLLANEISRMDIKVYGNINVYIGGIKIPYLYDIFSFLYNIYGGIRVISGEPYEAWD